MRVSSITAATLLVVPLASAHIAPRHHQGIHERQLLGGIIDDIFGISSSSTKPIGPTPVTPSSSTPPIVTPPSSSITSVSTTQPSSSQPPSSSTSSTPVSSSTPPPSSSSTPSPSTEPSSTAAPPPSSTSTSSSETPTTTETVESTTPSQTPTSVEPIVKTVNGETVTLLSTVGGNNTAAASNNSKSEPLSKGAIVGIAIGAAVAVLGLLAVLFMCLRRKRRSDEEVIQWPELNRHGDTDTHHALPVHTSGSAEDRRMSLGDELDGPAYLDDVNPNTVALSGSNFGSATMLHEYDEKTVSPQHYEHDYPPQGQHPHGYGFDDAHGDYTSYPPAVQPQNTPPATAYEWESSEGAYSGENGYAGMHRQTSPTMAGVGANAVSYPHVQQPGHHY